MGLAAPRRVEPAGTVLGPGSAPASSPSSSSPPSPWWSPCSIATGFTSAWAASPRARLGSGSAIYVWFPIAGIFALVTEWRALGSDPPQAGPLPSALRGLLAIQAVVLGLLGLGLLLFPESVATFWPWTLTPLTARAIGAWLLPIGLAGVWVVFENDLGRSCLPSPPPISSTPSS